jgi:anti-sigma28 factor (negative regulator of flagellin synthesis)
MGVEQVTKVALLYADDATLESGMDSPNQNALDDTFIDEERRKKIAKLKQAVANGTYYISAEQLADKLLEHMLEPKE